jgi:hypothetical protein
MLQKVPLLSLLFLGLLLCLSLHVEAFSEDVSAWERPYLVRRGHRRSLVVTEYGEISAAEISSGTKGPYHIQFITLEPNSLLLPVLLNADMVFYVHTGKCLSLANVAYTRRSIFNSMLYVLTFGCREWEVELDRWKRNEEDESTERRCI